MPKVAILYIALGRYTIFWDKFYNSSEKNLLSCSKHYFVWTDNPTKSMLKNKNVTIIKAEKKGWPYDILLRFSMFLEKEILKFDYVYFFNANFMFYNPVHLSEIAPHDFDNGLAAGLHPHPFSDNPDTYPYERRKESTAYIPKGSGKYFVCGAFNGGKTKDYIKDM